MVETLVRRTTAAVIGSVVAAASMPPSCGTQTVNGLSYTVCGSTWDQPQYVGTSVQYVVVTQPEPAANRRNCCS
jgi:hypothetical protein